MVEIEISLFETLDEVSKLLEDNETEEEEEFVLRMHKVVSNLKTFIENFFLQFFNYGFELEIEGITEEDLSIIEECFSDSKDSPKNMIASFKEAMEVLGDIGTAVYLDPPIDEDIYQAYMIFLPKLFASFKKDEHVLTERIENYGRIKVRMDGILSKIGILKEQRKLS